MAQIEDPVTTLARLLDTNIQVVKDDGSLADICVTTGWYDRELLKNVDGQVTVGLDHSEDQKLGFSASGWTTFRNTSSTTTWNSKSRPTT